MYILHLMVIYTYKGWSFNDFPFRSTSCWNIYEHLQRSLVPVLNDQLSFWKQYIDDTITSIKTRLVEYVLSINSFHHNIEFPYETEVNSKLTFLDILSLKEDQNITPTVYKKVKKSKSDTSLNWNSFCHQSWKRETLRSLAQRAHLIFWT